MQIDVMAGGAPTPRFDSEAQGLHESSAIVAAASQFFASLAERIPPLHDQWWITITATSVRQTVQGDLLLQPRRRIDFDAALAAVERLPHRSKRTTNILRQTSKKH